MSGVYTTSPKATKWNHDAALSRPAGTLSRPSGTLSLPGICDGRGRGEVGMRAFAPRRMASLLPLAGEGARRADGGACVSASHRHLPAPLNREPGKWCRQRRCRRRSCGGLSARKGGRIVGVVHDGALSRPSGTLSLPGICDGRGRGEVGMRAFAPRRTASLLPLAGEGAVAPAHLPSHLSRFASPERSRTGPMCICQVVV